MTDHTAKANYVKEDRCTTHPGGPLIPGGCKLPTPINVGHRLPGTVFVIHGVNDVGVSYGEVEAGLCDGLAERLDHRGDIIPAGFRNFTPEDRDKLVDDPDAVFFKRRVDKTTHSPVVPFYWGSREAKGRYKLGTSQPHGQNLDFYGNRLDKDFSKEGGPFANATNTLPDMWNKGQGKSLGIPDFAMADRLRPILGGPGRMYMILAAQRLAMMISMVRDYHRDDVVSLVGHSQGCLLSLLAQAFLLQWGHRPADSLVLTHPPYGLVDSVLGFGSTGGGEDAPMANDKRNPYAAIEAGQTLHARLQTLVNIVQGVAEKKHSTPDFQKLDAPSEQGLVGSKWKAQADRDNRGKVYLYFSPEDMTVGLTNVQGIGWQGVPDYQKGQQVQRVTRYDGRRPVGEAPQAVEVLRQPFAELTKCNGSDNARGFFQRVFTTKKRPDPQTGQTVMVGQPRAHDHALLLPGESTTAHAAEMGPMHPLNDLIGRASLDTARPTSRSVGGTEQAEAARRRKGIVTINGEPLPRPVAPDMYAGSLKSDDKRVPKGDPVGSWEDVDAIDATIAASTERGYQWVWCLVDDHSGDAFLGRVGNLMGNDGDTIDSPEPTLFKGKVRQTDYKAHAVKQHFNEGKANTKSTGEVKAVYTCLAGAWSPSPNGKLLVQRKETPDEVRLREQKTGTSTRSFHGAIFGSRLNHKQVTAYDIAIGQGEAISDPKFRAYLCAVADWRVKKPQDGEKKRQGILVWEKFLNDFGNFYNTEPKWRTALIEGTCDYYSTGILPDCLPVLSEEGLPPAVVCETKDCKQVVAKPPPAPPKKTAQTEPETMGEWLAANPTPSDLDAGDTKGLA